MTKYETLNIEIGEYVATVTIDRPPVNAMSTQLCRDLTSTFDELSDNPEVRVVILTSKGRIFCAGRDLKEAVKQPHEQRNRQVRAMYAAQYHCAVPVIGAINGPAIGAGNSLALFCDILIASDTATFSLPEINHGLSGGFATTRRGLNAYQGRKLYFTGEAASAEDFHRMGIVDSVVNSEALMQSARELALSLAAKPPLAMRAAKWTAKEVDKIPDLERAYQAIEERTNLFLLHTEDHKEAVAAFVEKRPGKFVGR